MTPRRDRLVALLLGLFAAGLLLWGARTEGYTRDEGYYFKAAELYWGWYGELGDNIAAGHPLRSFTRESVDHWFSYNHEHPALMKTLFAFSWRLLHKCQWPKNAGRHPVRYAHRHRTLNLLSEAEAFRLPTCLFAGMLVALVYLLCARTFSRRVGLLAAPLSLLMPQYFFHAQLACFDAPVAATWMLCVYLYFRSLTDSRYAVWCGVAFGIALATKLNGFFIPFAVLIHYLWVKRADLRALRMPPIPRAFWYMAILGPVILVAHWPWMWFDTVARMKAYMAFHLHHVYYNIEFLGVNYNKPPFPWDFTLVSTLLTVPATTLALALVGLVGLSLRPWLDRWRANRPPVSVSAGGSVPPRPPVWVWKPFPVGMAIRPQARRGPPPPVPDGATAPGFFVVLNVIIPLAIIPVTDAPIFGGVKHYLAAMPFIAILAGLGADLAIEWLCASLRWDKRAENAAWAVALVLFIAPSALETARSHPYGLSHYNLIAGGPAGGADLGMNRQFWGYSSRGVLPWLNRHAPRNANVYWHDANQDMLDMDVRDGLLRPDISNTGLEEPGVRGSTIAMVIHEMHFNKYEYWIWDFYGTAKPSLVLTHEGVPLVTVYERPLHSGTRDP